LTVTAERTNLVQSTVTRHGYRNVIFEVKPVSNPHNESTAADSPWQWSNATGHH